MNLNEWRSDITLIKSASELQDTDTFRAMLRVAEAELPSNHPLPPMGASATDHTYAYGIEVGYRRCLLVIEQMAAPVEERPDLVADFSEKNQ